MGPTRCAFLDLVMLKSKILRSLSRFNASRSSRLRAMSPLCTPRSPTVLVSLLFGIFEIFPCRGDVGLRAAQVRGDLPDLLLAVLRCLFYLSNLLAELGVALFLLLLYLLRECTRARQFLLSKAELLRGHIELAAQVRHTRVSLGRVPWPAVGAAAGCSQIARKLCTRRVAGIQEPGQPRNNTMTTSKTHRGVDAFDRCFPRPVGARWG